MSDLAAHSPTRLRRKYSRASALVANVLNKFYNGSARAVDPFVIRRLREEETRLFSIQCFLDEGPAESRRERKESSVSTRVSKAPTFSLLDRVFVVCGGYLGGPGSVMRRWEELSDAGYDDAMLEYVAIVDKIAPGWDQDPLEYPVAKQENFWKDDATALQCQYCGALFSLPTRRRHHCRLCLDVFCAECCSESLELALCPGAPLRAQRVCCQCFQDAERDKSLLEVRRVIRENHDLERQIKASQSATEAQLALKHREEAKLRQEAAASGCDMEAIDASIHRRVGPTGIGSGDGGGRLGLSAGAVDAPPAHRFAPRETVEANDQLALAHRQLLMGLKVAQCRGKKALERMDATLAVLREEVCFGSSNWNVVVRHACVYLTLRELNALARASKAHRAAVERCKCACKCVLAHGVAAAVRPALWQGECLKDEKTRLYVSDLAEEICALMDASDSDSGDDASSAEHIVPSLSTGHVFPPRPWLSLLEPLAHESLGPTTVWTRAYNVILARCKASPSALEFDAQIRGDVQRTFGISALRKVKHKTYQKATAPGTPPTPGPTVERRREALENVVRAFSSVNTEIGYCQGMDHVTAVLLSVVDWHEARAFWLLTSLVASPRYSLDALYSPGLPDLSLRCYQLEQLLHLYLPELARYLSAIDFPISMFATSWFLTLFTSMETLSYDVILHVFDGFAVAGWKQIFRIALVVVHLLQHQILASSFEEIPQIFYDVQEHAPAPPSADAKRNGPRSHSVIVPTLGSPTASSESNGHVRVTNAERSASRSEQRKPTVARGGGGALNGSATLKQPLL
ncbi:hypothetical protein PybrP1_003678 [[Pythium] brassicae (nom. inval.)]|nr:hypothetical protein PybrP1_003678 [[Pythium] brassicae (nom. inval.)]